MKYLIIMFSFLTLLGCQEAMKEAYIMKFEKFIEEVEKNKSTFDESKWKVMEGKFTELNEVEFKKFEGTLTPEERSKINSLKGKYYGIVATNKVNELGKKFKDVLEQVEGAAKQIEGAVDGAAKKVEKELDK